MVVAWELGVEFGGGGGGKRESGVDGKDEE